MSMRPILALLASAALAACAVGPDPAPPAIQPGAQAPFVTTAPRTLPGAEPDAAWWRLYDDPALDALVTRALLANTDLRVAAANLKAAEAVAAEARSARLPRATIDADVTFGRNQAPLFSPNDRTGYGGGLQVTYDVDLFGRISRAIQAAGADADAEAFARAAVQVRVAAAVTDAYLSACVASERIDAVRASVGVTEETARLVAAQERSGSASRLDLSRAEGQSAEARSALGPAEAARASALFELAALLGLPPREAPAAAAACRAAPRPKRPIAVGDGASLLRRRPDVAEAERRVLAATARIGVAKADLYPRVSIGANVNRSGGDGVSSDQGFSFGLGPVLSFTFPDTGAGRARVRQAESRAEAALAAFDGVVLTALKEVEQALSNYDAATRAQADLTIAEDRAEQAFALADLRYRAGSIAYLDVLTAQADLVRLRLARNQADQTLASSRVDLFRALGGGWEPAG